MDPQYILQIGTSINIKRTDGRIHGALIASIDEKEQMACVEWTEQGEIKGKEMSLSSIAALNPDIIIPSKELVNECTTNTYNNFNHLQRNPTKQSILINGRSNLPQSKQTTNGQAASTSEVRESNIPIKNFNSRKSHFVSEIPKNKPKETNLPTGNLVPNHNAVNTSNSRRSTALREVEKLRKNREERRQRQAEEKAEKDAFLQSAPGNPHWELFNMIKEYRKELDIKTLAENEPVEDHQITVCVRKRPLNKKELKDKEVDVITIPSKNQLIVHEPKNKVDLTKFLENQVFKFDYAFDENCSNELVYRFTAQPLIKTIFEGGFATCFAYGQTGSGKTHTMGGDFTSGKSQNYKKGIYAMATTDIFKLVSLPKYRNLVVSVSFFEIYSGKVFDLLNNKVKLRILEDGKKQVQVVGLEEKVVSNVADVLSLIQKGNQARTSGQTSANNNSSRSHAVFQIYLRSTNSMSKIHGKFSIIDLAGNERGADTSSADRQTRMEGAEINKSLLALKECIRALGHRGAHLPFRASKLTQVLRDSFVGANSRTCMIAMISPGVNSCEHTLNTLRYANRVKELEADDPLTINESDDENEDPGTDLLQVQSLNEEDMSPDLYNLHQMLSELDNAEEKMLDTHKEFVDTLTYVSQEFNNLLRTSASVGYDQEAYCRSWNKLLNDFQTVLGQTAEVTEDFEKKLTAEEQLSRRINSIK